MSEKEQAAHFKKTRAHLVSLDEGLERLGRDSLGLLLAADEEADVVAEGLGLPSLGVELARVGEVGNHTTDVLKNRGKDRLVRHELDERESLHLGREVVDRERREEDLEGRDSGGRDVTESSRLRIGGSSRGLKDGLGGSGEGTNLQQNERIGSGLSITTQKKITPERTSGKA